MGEHIKYKGNSVKIGTCEDLYYARYGQIKEAVESGKAKFQPGNAQPERYLDPGCGWRYRFPFPDEDSVEIGCFRDFDRGWLLPANEEFCFSMKTHEVAVMFDPFKRARTSPGEELIDRITFPCPYSEVGRAAGITAPPRVEVLQQKFVEAELQTIIRCPYCRKEWSLDYNDAIQLCSFSQRGFSPERDEVLNRIIAGYFPN
jgi:hypothetical protein